MQTQYLLLLQCESAQVDKNNMTIRLEVDLNHALRHPYTLLYSCLCANLYLTLQYGYTIVVVDCNGCTINL